MQLLTEEEYSIVSRFLFLSMAIIVIKQDIKHIKHGAFKIKEPYMKLLKKMESQAFEEQKGLRKTMKEQRMDVVTLNKNDSSSSFLFLCQNKEEKRDFFNPAIRKKVEAIILEHLLKALPALLPQADSLYASYDNREEIEIGQYGELD